MQFDDLIAQLLLGDISRGGQYRQGFLHDDFGGVEGRFGLHQGVLEILEPAHQDFRVGHPAVTVVFLGFGI